MIWCLGASEVTNKSVFMQSAFDFFSIPSLLSLPLLSVLII